MDEYIDESLKENIFRVRERIAHACQKAGRSERDITLVAVSKNVGVDNVRQAAQLDICNFGENYVEEFLNKYNATQDIAPKLHLIGHLQTNKVQHIVGKAHLIHSLDSVRLAKHIDKEAAKQGIVGRCLLQVNVSGEQSKFGISLQDCEMFLEQVGNLKNLKIEGLMTMAPLVSTQAECAHVFYNLNKKFIDISRQKYDNVNMRFLSMGMSNDFEVAIEQGSNIVRVGRAIFGDKKSAV